MSEVNVACRLDGFTHESRSMVIYGYLIAIFYFKFSFKLRLLFVDLPFRDDESKTQKSNLNYGTSLFPKSHWNKIKICSLFSLDWIFKWTLSFFYLSKRVSRDVLLENRDKVLFLENIQKKSNYFNSLAIASPVSGDSFSVNRNWWMLTSFYSW